MVQTLESTTPTPLQEVKTGDHIQCADTAGDSLQPGKIEWCEVFNWVRQMCLRDHAPLQWGQGTPIACM